MEALTTIQELKRQVADYLEKSAALDAAVTIAYPAGERDYPRIQAAVAVGIEEMAAAAGGLGGFWGANRENGDPLHGSGIAITLRFDLYAPGRESGGGDRLHQLFEGLCDALMLRENPFRIQKLWCGGTGYDKQEAAFHMAAFATLQAALLRSGETVALEDFQLRLTGEG